MVSLSENATFQLSREKMSLSCPDLQKVETDDGALERRRPIDDRGLETTRKTEDDFFSRRRRRKKNT